MGTTIRPKLSEKNKYWLEKHRYYELKHFCLQYPIWRKACGGLIDLPSTWASETKVSSGDTKDPTAKCAEARAYYLDRMALVEDSARAADEQLWSYILKAVTEELSYDHLRTKLNIPCCKDVYYELYRRFFWILDKARQ